MAIEAEVLSGDQKCACMLVLDTSGSMGGEPIDHLNQGLVSFEKQVKANALAARRLDIGIVTFGNQGVALVQDFVSGRQFSAPALEADGDTPMGEAVRLALNAIRERKDKYQRMGIPYYRPWLMLITDGEPTDDDWEEAAAELTREEARKGVSCFPIGVGDGADLTKLAHFSSKPPVMLRGLEFENLFSWLSRSLSKVSASGTGDQVALPSNDSWTMLAP